MVKETMRIWSLHPKYLDRQGLIALWREGLLAQKVLEGKTRGYIHHPQLIRFRRMKDPLSAIGSYLHHVEVEAGARGYHFNRSKILRPPIRTVKMKVTRGQLKYEAGHLLQKLARRDPKRFREMRKTTRILAHPCFHPVSGGVERWEKLK